MIFTPAYRKFHAEFMDFTEFVTDNIENPPADFDATLIRGARALAEYFEGDDRVVTIPEDEFESVFDLMRTLVNNGYCEAADLLLPLSHCSTDTVFEQQVAQFQQNVVFSETYGLDGSTVFGEDIMAEHLRGLEAVHETEMTPKAFYGLEASLNAFKTYLSWYPQIGADPFEASTITDDYRRLARIVRGA